MKKRLLCFVLVLSVLLSTSIEASAKVNSKKFPYKVKVTNTDGIMQKKYNAPKEDLHIIRSYKQLKALKKKIKNKYWHSKEQLKKLKKYNKKFFKKNALCYAAVLYDGYATTELSEVVKCKNKLKMYINIDWFKFSGITTCDVKNNYDTFLLEVKKKDIKGIKKIKVIRNVVEDDNSENGS